MPKLATQPVDPQPAEMAIVASHTSSTDASRPPHAFGISR